MTSMGFRCLALALTSVSLSFGAQAQDDQIIYDDARENGWQDYSWATIDYSNPNPVHSGTHSISVTDPTANYQAVYLHHTAQNTALYASMRFWVYVTATNPTPLSVQALRNGDPQAAFVPGNLMQNNWTQVTIPLATLGVSNVADFDGFWIQNNTGAAQTWYVDDVSLVAAPPPNPVQVTIDAAAVIRTIDDRIYGLNTAIWDQELGSAATAQLLTDMNAQYLRFPGGSASDNYDWHTDRSVSGGTFQWPSNAATFALLTEAKAAQGVITVNYGSGTPEEAAAWVAYYNSTVSNSTALGVDSQGSDWKTAGYWAGLRSASPLATDDGLNFLVARP